MSFSPTVSPSFLTQSRSFPLSLIFCSQNFHGLSFSSSSPLTTATATATTTNHNLNPQPPKKKKKKTTTQIAAKTHHPSNPNLNHNPYMNPPITQIRFYKTHPLIPMIQGLRWLWQGDLEELVRRACGVGQGNLEECEACGGSREEILKSQ